MTANVLFYKNLLSHENQWIDLTGGDLNDSLISSEINTITGLFNNILLITFASISATFFPSLPLPLQQHSFH